MHTKGLSSHKATRGHATPDIEIISYDHQLLTSRKRGSGQTVPTYGVGNVMLLACSVHQQQSLLAALEVQHKSE